jgi:hypothetical protein
MKCKENFIFLHSTIKYDVVTVIIIVISMEYSSTSEADSRWVSQYIPCLLWNPEVHYIVRKRPPLVLSRNQLSSVYTLTPYSFKIWYYPPIYE